MGDTNIISKKTFGLIIAMIISILVLVILIYIRITSETINETTDGAQASELDEETLKLLGIYGEEVNNFSNKEIMWRELIRRDQAIEAYLTGYVNQMVQNIKEMNDVIYNQKILFKPLHLVIPPDVIIITDKTSVLKEHEQVIKNAFANFQGLSPIDKLEALGRYSKYLAYDLDDETVIINNPYPSGSTKDYYS